MNEGRSSALGYRYSITENQEIGHVPFPFAVTHAGKKKGRRIPSFPGYAVAGVVLCAQVSLLLDDQRRRGPCLVEQLFPSNSPGLS